MNRSLLARAALALASTALLGCATSNNSPAESSVAADIPAGPNMLSSAEQGAGWRLLFDGTTLNGWRGYRMDSMPRGWSVVNGEMTKTGGSRDIVTKEQFGDFELVFDWKLTRGGNAGVFFRGTEEYDRIYWSAPEYQLLDDPNAADGRNRLTAAGAAYGLWPAPAGVVKAADEWNTTKIVARGAHVEHWLNGQKLLEYEAWGPEWAEKVKASKFRDYPNFGLAKSGLIGFQGDHGGTLSLRNIKLRPLR